MSQYQPLAQLQNVGVPAQTSAIADTAAKQTASNTFKATRDASTGSAEQVLLNAIATHYGRQMQDFLGDSKGVERHQKTQEFTARLQDSLKNFGAVLERIGSAFTVQDIARMAADVVSVSGTDAHEASEGGRSSQAREIKLPNALNNDRLALQNVATGQIVESFYQKNFDTSRQEALAQADGAHLGQAQTTAPVKGGSNQAQAVVSEATESARQTFAKAATAGGDVNWLSQALLGKSASELNASERVALNTIQAELAAGAIKPKTQIAPNVPDQAMEGQSASALPEGALGAFALTGEDTKSGTVLISQALATAAQSDPKARKQLAQTAAEETGEAIAARYTELTKGSDASPLAAGDAGDRLARNAAAKANGQTPAVTKTENPDAFRAAETDTGTVSVDGQTYDAKLKSGKTLKQNYTRFQRLNNSNQRFNMLEDDLSTKEKGQLVDKMTSKERKDLMAGLNQNQQLELLDGLDMNQQNNLMDGMPAYQKAQLEQKLQEKRLAATVAAENNPTDTNFDITADLSSNYSDANKIKWLKDRTNVMNTQAAVFEGHSDTVIDSSNHLTGRHDVGDWIGVKKGIPKLDKSLEAARAAVTKYNNGETSNSLSTIANQVIQNNPNNQALLTAARNLQTAAQSVDTALSTLNGTIQKAQTNLDQARFSLASNHQALLNQQDPSRLEEKPVTEAFSAVIDVVAAPWDGLDKLSKTGKVGSIMSDLIDTGLTVATGGAWAVAGASITGLRELENMAQFGTDLNASSFSGPKKFFDDFIGDNVLRFFGISTDVYDALRRKGRQEGADQSRTLSGGLQINYNHKTDSFTGFLYTDKNFNLGPLGGLNVSLNLEGTLDPDNPNNNNIGFTAYGIVSKDLKSKKFSLNSAIDGVAHLSSQTFLNASGTYKPKSKEIEVGSGSLYTKIGVDVSIEGLGGVELFRQTNNVKRIDITNWSGKKFKI